MLHHRPFHTGGYIFTNIRDILHIQNTHDAVISTTAIDLLSLHSCKVIQLFNVSNFRVTTEQVVEGFIVPKDSHAMANLIKFMKVTILTDFLLFWFPGP